MAQTRLSQLLRLSLLLLTTLSTAQIIHTPSLLPPRELIGTASDESDADFPGTKFHTFVSRPDIKAPKFHLQIYDREALAPGYWFVAPYHNLDQTDNAKKWVGPYIYDSNGELVWCGAKMFNHFNTYDFRISRFQGEDMLSLKDNEHGVGTIFDNTYTIRQEVEMHTNDMHEFNMIDGGRKVLTVTSTDHHSTVKQAEAVGFGGNRTCRSLWKGFQVLDTRTSEVMWEWNAKDHLGLDESTNVNLANDYELLCGSGWWDILHINAVDQFADGDFLVSARHTDALYKINHKNGSVVWRLGGTKSDFTFATEDVKFSRQHHATARGQNATHTMVGIFDNAIGTSSNEIASHENSRGLLLALEHETMIASVEREYDHPDGAMTNSRGSFQTLPNGNAFMGWTYHTQLSEHTNDGRLIMQASLKLPGHCYRSYKFQWVGHPTQEPDVHSKTVKSGKNGDKTLKTMMYVSWNGATEVHTWNLHRSDETGNVTDLIASMPRQGFETSLVYDGYASHVVAEALDQNGNQLGRSAAVRTLTPSEDFDKFSQPVLDDTMWLQDNVNGTIVHRVMEFAGNPWVAFACGVGASLAVCFIVWCTLRSRRKLFVRWKGDEEKKVIYDSMEEGGEREDRDTERTKLMPDEEDRESDRTQFVVEDDEEEEESEKMKLMDDREQP